MLKFLRSFSTWRGAGPAGSCTIFLVTSTNCLLIDKPSFPCFSGHRWILIPVQGIKFVTRTKWPRPSDPWWWSYQYSLTSKRLNCISFWNWYNKEGYIFLPAFWYPANVFDHPLPKLSLCVFQCKGPFHDFLRTISLTLGMTVDSVQTLNERHLHLQNRWPH